MNIHRLKGAFCVVVALLAGGFPSQAQSIYTPYDFATFAGQPGVPGDTNGTGEGAQFYLPHGIAADNAGNLYVADTQNHIIRKIDPAGFVTLVAGSPGNKGSVDGVTFGAAQFNSPMGLSSDASGNLYVADSGSQTVRMITSGGVVTTIAGQAGVTGNANGDGTNALFNQPNGTAADSAGNIYVADLVNRVIRKISGGVVTNFAGADSMQGTNDGIGSAARFTTPAAVATDLSNNVYVADQGGDTIRFVTPDGTVTTLAGAGKKSGTNDGVGSEARFSAPQGVAVDAARNVYVSDSGNQTIRMIGPGGVVTTLAGSPGQSGSSDGTNNGAAFNAPKGIVVDSQTNIYVADSGNSTIRKLAREGTNWVVTTLAGNPGQNGSTDGAGVAARFHFTYGVAVDSSGNVYATDRLNDSVRKISPAGVVTTIAGVSGLPGSTDGTGAGAEFNQPVSVAVDGLTNIYVADFQNITVRKIAPVGTNWVTTTLAGSAGLTGTNDGQGSAARFSQFHGVAVDGSQNVYVTDTGNVVIRKITPDGNVTTLAGKAGQGGLTDGTGSAARFGGPVDVVSDFDGNLAVVDGNSIRQVSSAAVVTTIAGCPAGGCTNAIGSMDGPGLTARFAFPAGIARDSAGNLYVADAGNDTIRLITNSGSEWMVTTLAGLPGQAGAVDGAGMVARFNFPSDVAVDANGTVYMADTDEDRIAKGAPATSGPTAVVQFDTSAGNLTVASGFVHLLMDVSTSSGSLVLETSTNLQTWTPFQTNALSGAPIPFSIPIGQAADRFFRGVVGP